MADKRTLSARLDELATRFDALEERLHSGSHQDTEEQHGYDSQRLYCAVPERPQREFGPEVSADRAAAILAIGNKWVNGTELHYYLYDSGPFGGDRSQHDVVEEAFDVWKNTGIGLTFTKVPLPSQSEIRIGFARGNGSWSTVGTDALNVGQLERTMNFGWNINVPGRHQTDQRCLQIVLQQSWR